MRKDLEEILRHELWEMDLPEDASLEVIQEKGGVAVCRVFAEGRRFVLKYFEHKADRREITAYQFLGFAEIPTIPLLLYTGQSLLLEDLNDSGSYRLGRVDDLADPSAARALARWYRSLHEKGREAAGLPGFSRETDALTAENLRQLSRRLGAYPGEAFLMDHLGRLHDLISSLEETLIYNDFSPDNLAVARDGSAALPFDYGRMGFGYVYADLRSVTHMLSPEAGRAFLTEYGAFDPLEGRVDQVASPLAALLEACRGDGFPAWAEPYLEVLQSGLLLRRLQTLLG